ncbi:hypothetical protein [Halorhodospira halophila]|uniref:hypothetical protein n=1 Tax=Halorhodospira halophila TaxID=1053 RepID=UPI001914CC42|nr:hypothetical protein [Halorhodospira halophila]MBK5937236.1 hypothetical protein [Halorhodospira halophila]
MAHWRTLSGLFGPRWRHPDPATRRRAAMDLDPNQPETAEALAALIDDPAPPVREAAAKRCSDLATLRRLRRDDPDASVRTAATVRYRQRLVGDAAPEAVTAELRHCDDPTVAAHIAQQGRTPAVRRAALAHLGQAPVLREVALHDDDPETRLHAVEQLSDPKILRDLAERARSLAPEVAEAAERRLNPPAPPTTEGHTATTETDAAPAADHDDPAPATGAAASLANAMTGLAEGGWWPGYHTRRRALMARWRELDEPWPPALSERFRQATQAALMQQPRNHGGDATRTRLQLEQLLTEIEGQEDPARAAGQRLEALSRSVAELAGDHPDEARARILLQRLGRRIPQLRPRRPAGGAVRPPRRAGDQCDLAAVARSLAEAEEAIAGGDLRRVRQALAEAQRLVGPPPGGEPPPG